jgi:hypothetical protein
VTPLPEDVAWIVEHVPDGECVLINDVGMVGGIPGICVLDMRGLVTRASAEADLERRQDTWFNELLTSKARPFAVRQAWWAEDPREPARWLVGKYPARTDLRYPGGAVGWFSDEDRRLDSRMIAQRWLRLSQQHPDHPWIAWRASIAAANAGDIDGAHTIARSASHRWPEVDMVADDPSRWSFVGGTAPLEWEAGDGFVLFEGETLETRPLSCGQERLVVIAEGAASVDVENLATGAVEIRSVPDSDTALPFSACGLTDDVATQYRVRIRTESPNLRAIVRVESE